MTDVQEKLFELLIEVKELCEKENIEYYLCEYLLLDALQNKKITGTYHDFSIMINSCDVKKFIKAVNKKENREMEGLFNNPKFPGTYMRYVAKDTLYFPIYRYKIYNKIGFGINIKILKNVPKNRIKSKVYTAMEAGIEINNNVIKMTKRRLVCLLFIKMLGIMGNKNRAKFIFNSLNSTTLGNARKKYVYYKPTLGKRVKYKRSIFDETTTVKLNGVSFTIPKDNRFIDINIGDVNKPIRMSTFGNTYIIDPNIPYKLFLEECKSKNFSNKFYSRRKKLLKYDLKIKPYKKYVSKCWDLLYRTRDRFEMYDKYMPQKDNIIKLYNDNNFEELQVVLNDYLEVLDLYYKKGLGIVFDPVIFQITIDLLVKMDKKNLAKNYIKYVPKEYFIPLEDDLGLK